MTNLMRTYPREDYRVGLHKASYKGVIKVGDTIVTTTWNNDYNEVRMGVIKSISIATDDHDVAGENDTSCDTQSYDTRLEYQGSITYGNDYWCYFNQVLRKENDNDKSSNES